MKYFKLANALFEQQHLSDVDCSKIIL